MPSIIASTTIFPNGFGRQSAPCVRITTEEDEILTEDQPPNSYFDEPHRTTRNIAPYIKPSKFTPKLNFASSVDRDHVIADAEFDGPIRPKWNPPHQKVTLTTYRRVNYEPPPERVPTTARRNSLTVLMDNKLQDLNQKFKENISQMSQGLCYNKTDRKMESDLDNSSAIKDNGKSDKSIEANPLIYFKYDFGYEFGIADPKVVIRSSSEPPMDLRPALPSSSDESGVIHLPIIHEKTT